MNNNEIAKELRELAPCLPHPPWQRKLLAAADIVEKQADLFTLTDCLASALVGEFKAETALEAYLKELAHDYDKENMRVRLRSKIAERDALKAKVEELELRHAAVMLHTQGVVDENARLMEDIGKCHDALGESRDSDTSELWKAFENLQHFIPRVNWLEEENARLKTALQRIADYQGRFGEDDPQSIAKETINQES